MNRLVIESWLLLFYFDCLMRLRDFKRVHSAVHKQKVHAKAVRTQCNCLSRAVDFACVFYFKPVRCLQRSAATAVLLRLHGWPGEMVIGAQLIPFQSHAWVEVEGCVINDKPYISEIFQEMERC